MARAPRFEGSPEDRRSDRSAAKARGMSQRDYEKTAEDRVHDTVGQARFNRGERGFRKGGKVPFGGKKAAPFGKRGRK